MSALRELHGKYVIAPIDKATDNISFICKHFYALILKQELGLNFNNPITSPTYTQVMDADIPAVINKHLRDLSNKFGYNDIHEDNHRLPTMYWLPKMHKNPIKARFIVAAPKCSIKPLSKAITSIFKLLITQTESYNKKLQFFSGVNTFWVISNNQPITNAINKLNNRQRAKSISTFDFSTLYTKIPHDKLLFVLNSLVDFCFKGGMSQFIAIKYSEARWVQDPFKDKVVFGKLSIKAAVKYLMENCYFTIGNKLFRQIIGIPMGSDPAPFFANLFLYYYESKWLKNVQRSDLHRARKFANT